MVKTPPFHGGNMGSSPVRVTTTKKSAEGGLLCRGDLAPLCGAKISASLKFARGDSRPLSRSPACASGSVPACHRRASRNDTGVVPYEGRDGGRACGRGGGIARICLLPRRGAPACAPARQRRIGRGFLISVILSAAKDLFSRRRSLHGKDPSLRSG